MQTSSYISDTFTATLESIIADSTDGVEKKYSQYKKWAKEDTMDGPIVDDLQLYMPDLVSEKPEGQKVAVGSMGTGIMNRYIPRTYGLQLEFTQELMDDCKYDVALDAAGQLKKAMYRSIDTDMTLILMRMFDTAYTFGDGVCLGNASHPLPGGGTYSNIMAVPKSPSPAALDELVSTCAQMVGIDGHREGYTAEMIVHPVQQKVQWAALLGSDLRPEAGNFAEINVIKKDYNINHIGLTRWTSSATQWACTTSCEGGPVIKWRKKPYSKQWDEPSGLVKSYAMFARWAKGVSNARSIYCVNA